MSRRRSRRTDPACAIPGMFEQMREAALALYPPRTVATHRRPDADAIVSAWLAQRFLFGDEPSEVVFVDRGYVPADCQPEYDCVVDVGRSLNIERNEYDHKSPAFESRDETCATRLLWERLLADGRP